MISINMVTCTHFSGKDFTIKAQLNGKTQKASVSVDPSSVQPY
jgi:hypothetical protein